ncbi:hypothetical protein PG990_001017 [Apiospora arundinis]
MERNISENAEATISLLGLRSPSHKYEGMMSIKGSVPSPRKTPLRAAETNSSVSSSIGLLDKFPSEVVVMIMAQLDLQSLARFAKVSFQGDGFVQSCREYRDLLQFVPETIEAYCRLGLLDLHPVADIHRALWTAQCDTCCSPGPFLFLPTCQRCCLGCLDHNPALRLMTPTAAENMYGLTKSQVETLRVVHVRKENVHPGFAGLVGGRGRFFFNYGIVELTYSPHDQVVVAQAARRLAIAAHGGSESAALARVQQKYEEDQSRGRRVSWTLENLEWWFNGHAQPPRHESLKKADVLLRWGCRWCLSGEGHSSAKYASMATMPFPTLTRGAEDGTLQLAEGPVWCWGCDVARVKFEWFRVGSYQNIREHEAWACIPARYSDSSWPPQKLIYMLADMAHTKESFLRHVQECPYSQWTLRHVEPLND